MFRYKHIFIPAILLIFLSACSPKMAKEITPEKATYIATLPTVTIPLGGNAFFASKDDQSKITNNGLTDWNSANTIASVYFKALQPGTYYLSLKTKNTAESKIAVTILGKKQEISLPANNAFEESGMIEFKADKSEYIRVDLQGISKNGNTFADVSDLIVRGDNADSLAFVKDNKDHRFHFGRRGPSIHLNFLIPENVKEKVEYFYNEIRVPQGEDVLGSYFQANGFSFGYFGIQVNSPTERRILFSVWSPFHTDNPNEIPEEDKIILIKKGTDVYTGEFGNEGSGGQSFLRYNWKTENNYAFLLKAAPDAAQNRTVFTAYFKDPDIDKWILIASFSRPKTNTYLKNCYSFLENFHTETGHVQRKGLFTNQWIRTTDQQWIPIDKIRFTADDIARRGQRLDYRGGVEGNYFFLENCGFFNDNTTISTEFKREIPAGSTAPDIDFQSLP